MEKKRQNDNPLVIPFGRAVRVGNFKLWRGNYVIEEGKKKMPVECVYVSNLDGSWMTRIPATVPLYGIIIRSYATVDENIREQFLAGEVFSNLEAINTSGSVALHHSFRMLYQALHYPFIFMTEKELTSWVKNNFDAGDKKDMKKHLDNLLSERKEFYDMIEKERRDYLDTWEEQRAKIKESEDEAQKQLEQDEIAEQAMDILNGEEDEQKEEKPSDEN